MLTVPNNHGFIELTIPDENGSDTMFPCAIRLEDIVTITDISHVDRQQLSRTLKYCNSVIKLRHNENAFGVVETTKQIVDQIRRP